MGRFSFSFFSKNFCSLVRPTQSGPGPEASPRATRELQAKTQANHKQRESTALRPHAGNPPPGLAPAALSHTAGHGAKAKSTGPQ